MNLLMPHKMYVTKVNMNKFAKALHNGVDATIQFAHKHLIGDEPIALMKSQYNRVQKAIKSGTGLRLKFKHSHIKKMVKGGFLPLLLGGLATGIASAIGAWGTNKLISKAEGRGAGIHPSLLTGLATLGTAAAAYGAKKLWDSRGDGLSDFGDINEGAGLTNFGAMKGAGRVRGAGKKNLKWAEDSISLVKHIQSK